MDAVVTEIYLCQRLEKCLRLSKVNVLVFGLCRSLLVLLLGVKMLSASLLPLSLPIGKKMNM